MKKMMSLCLAVFWLLWSAGALAETADSTELVVFAAASMTETLTALKPLYEAEHPGIELVFNFDSSGTLKTQIEEGAACDIFLSAAQKQMDQLSELRLVLEDSRVDLLENKVVLAVPEGNPKGLTSFDQLAELLQSSDVFLAMGNSDVPVGQYTQKIFAWYGLNEEALAKQGLLTYGSNVKEVTTQVSEASVDAGIVYGTDAASAGLSVVDSATAEMCGQVIYPIAVLNTSAHTEAAQTFFDYLMSEEAAAVFESVGFSMIEQP